MEELKVSGHILNNALKNESLLFSNEYLSKLNKIFELYKAATNLDCKFFLNHHIGDSCLIDDSVKNLFCPFICSCQDRSDQYNYQIHKKGLLALELGQPYIYLCHLGLVEWAVPIVKGKNYLGTVISGCVRLWQFDNNIELEMREILEKMKLDWQNYFEYLKQLPIMSPEHIQASAELLFNNICYYMDSDKVLIEKNRNIWHKRSCLAEEVAEQKKAQIQRLNIKKYLINEYPLTKNLKSNSKRNHSIIKSPPQKKEQELLYQSRLGNYPDKETFKINNYTPLTTKNVISNNQTKKDSFKNSVTKKEQELMGRIQLGDQSGAKEILNKIMGEIFLQNPDDLDIIKARLLELFITIGRAAIQKLNSGDNLFRLYYDAVQGLQNLSDIEEVCLWTTESFDKLIRLIYINRDNSKYTIVVKIIEYLQDHMSNEVSINEISKAVFLSPFYLSRLFKEELGITIIEYLTEIRMEKAKSLLEKTDMTIAEITNNVGYNEISYFSRLFKRRVGISPTKYRNWWQTEKY